LRVLARNTVFSYKNRTVAPQEIGRRLGVSAILTGRVLQFGERLIVRVELVETANGWQMWGEQYDRQSSDILELQETIAREISGNLQVKLTGEEKRRLTKRYTASSEAYHLYIKGRYHLNKRLTPAIERAADFFQQAIDVDPDYALAYVGLADCYPLLSLYGVLTPQEAYSKAEAAALKALEFDEQSAKAYNALGVVKLFYEWDWAGAETAFQQAIKLNLGYPDAHQRMGMFLTAMGNFDEAVAEFERAVELDPLSLITNTISGYPFYYGRRYQLAVERFQAVIALDENYSMAHFRLGLTFAQQGKFENAIAELEKSVAISNDRDSIAALGYVQGLAENYAPAKASLAELDEREKTGFVTSYNSALVNLGLSDYDAALDWLERAYNERSYWLIYLKVDPALDPLRENPRFHDLLNRVFGVQKSPIVAANENFSADTASAPPSARNKI
jgi:tetratricopeptide (TPR) repeat protein